MRIVSYEYTDIEPDKWRFSPVQLGRVNLLVGNTGSGKTRFLNTLFNLAASVARPAAIAGGRWRLKLEQDEVDYEWEIEIQRDEQNRVSVEHEVMKNTQNGTILFERNSDSIRFFDSEMPKLTHGLTAFALFKEDERIAPFFHGFERIMRRNFSSNELDEYTKYEVVHSEQGIEDIEDLFKRNLNINWKIYHLSSKFPDTFDRIREQFVEVFPFVERIELKELQTIRPNLRVSGYMPVLAIKETNVREWIPSGELSSGMKKVLLIMTDINSLPAGSTYMIDEYENSLGINAINFLPTLLAEADVDAQFIITSHHPYLINKIDPDDWYIFHRSGSDVKIRYGSENLQKFGRSKQQRFIQLLNDPFYTDGVE